MNSPNAIQILADARIVEAESLYNAGHYDLSFYIAGYAVELYFKARICNLLQIPNFFDFGNRKKFVNEDSITKPYKVHNFNQLLVLSGLLNEHRKALTTVNFKNDWMVLEIWNESQRYTSGKTQQDAFDFITSVKNYTTWIKQFL